MKHRKIGANYLKDGSWNVICDVCGQKFKTEQTLKRWDGLVVCKKDWEPRHPQELIRMPVETGQAVPDARPDTQPNYIGPNYINIYVDAGYTENQGMQTYFVEL